MVIAGQGRPNRSCQCERQWHVGAVIDRGPRQTLCGLPVVVLRRWPFQQMALLMAPGGERIGRRVARVDLCRLGQQPQRLVIFVGRLGKGREHRAQGQIIGILVRRRLAPDAIELRGPQYRADRTDDALGDPVLQIE